MRVISSNCCLPLCVNKLYFGYLGSGHEKDYVTQKTLRLEFHLPLNHCILNDQVSFRGLLSHCRRAKQNLQLEVTWSWRTTFPNWAMFMLSLLLHSFTVASPIQRQVYAGAKVVHFNVTNAAQQRTVQSLVSSGKARYLADTAMDLIIPAHVDYSKVDVPSTCIVDDLQALIDKEEAYSRSTENQFAGDAFFKDYRNADEYVDYLKAQPNVTSFNLGQTYENRTVVALQFGSGPKYIILQGGMHAREWISPAALTYVASFLTSSDPKALELNRKFTFIVVPVLNPDGYAFSRLKSKGDRLWRKNRQPTGDPNCPGIDINRSYKFKFGGPGSSSDKCDEAYRGPEPFAAIEATFVTRLIEKLGPKNVISYTDFHSYGQLFIVLLFDLVSDGSRL